MHAPSYTKEEDGVLLSYTADLDPKDYETRTKEFTSRFKQAALRLPGRDLNSLRKRYARLRNEGRVPAVNPVSATPYKKVPPTIAKVEIWNEWEGPFITPPSKDRLMGRR